MEFDEIRPIKDRLADKLMGHPSQRVRLLRHHNVNGVGLSKDESGWYIKVCLVKQHQWWHRKLMTNYCGARVRCQVIGVVRAL